MLFNHCLVTNSLCGPSRAAIITGKYSNRNHFYANSFGERFDGSQQTFPKLLHTAGYQTAIVGKWHLISDPTGFDYWNILPGQGVYYNPGLIEMGKQSRHPGYVTEVITDVTLDWLKNKRDPNKPFLLMCQHKAPHRNWEPGPKYLNLYKNIALPEPDNLFDDYSGRGTGAHQQEMEIAKNLTNGSDLKIDWIPPGLTAEQKKAWQDAYGPENEEFKNAHLTGKDLVRWKYQRFLKDYLRCVAAVDESVGRLLKYLDDTGLAKNTIVVYSSDQGFFLGEHGWFDKRWIYTESLHTPLIVRWPGHTAPKSTSDAMVSNLDFAETFLDAAGLPVPDDMQGRSMVPILNGKPPADWRTAFYYHYYEAPAEHNVPHHYGVTTLDHKLIYFPQLKEWELYDLKKDPHEMHSVYGDAAYAPVQSQLHQELARQQQRLGDTTPDRPVKEILAEERKAKEK
jgi:arylsulfatase A-like enzyme